MSDKPASATILLAVTLLLGGTTPLAAGEIGDPTRPSHIRNESRNVETRAPSWVVESIIVSPERKLATINGRVVGINEWVGGARVVEILPYEVRLEYKGESRRISLIPIRVKKPATGW